MCRFIVMASFASLIAASAAFAGNSMHWNAEIDGGKGRVITGFDDGTDSSGYWKEYNDQADGGSSLFRWPTDVNANEYGNFFGPLVTAYHGIKGTAELGSGYDYPYTGLRFNLVNNALDSVDITGWNGMCVTYTSSKAFYLELGSYDEQKTTQYNNYKTKLPASTTQTTLNLPWTKFAQESGWGISVTQATALKEMSAIKIKFSGTAGSAIDFNIYEIGSYGQCTGVVISAVWDASTPATTRIINGATYYVITTAQELAWVAQQTNAGTTVNAILGNDIALTEGTVSESTKPWTPIGTTNSTAFNGIFDGAGHKVSGIYVAADGSSHGFFGYIGSSGIVKNLILENGSINGDGNTGALAGESQGTISNVINKMDVNGNDYNGGIVGNGSGTITKCTNYGAITGRQASGIAGLFQGNISKCLNYGTILGTENAYGITTTPDSIFYSANFGTVTGSRYIDGLGWQFFISSYNAGLVKASSDNSTPSVDNVRYTSSHLDTLTAAEMQADKFAWMLNTADGDSASSGVWSRGNGYPVFADANHLATHRVRFIIGKDTTAFYTDSTGKLQAASIPAVPTKKDSTFIAWVYGNKDIYNTTAVINRDADVTPYFASSDIDIGTCYYYDEDETTLITKRVAETDGTCTDPETNPKKDSTAQYSYKFDGWVMSGNDTHTFSATYAPTVRKYKINFQRAIWIYEWEHNYYYWNNYTYQSNEFEYGALPAFDKADYKMHTGDSIPKRESSAQYDYTFKTWTPEIIPVTDTATYTAVFDSTLRKYTVTYVNKDGAELWEHDFEYGTTPVYNGPNPTVPPDASYAYTWTGKFTPAVTAVTGRATYTATYNKTKVNSSGSTSSSSAAKTFLWSGDTDYGIGRVVTEFDDGSNTSGYWTSYNPIMIDYIIWPTDVKANEKGNFYGPLIEKYKGIKGSTKISNYFDFGFYFNLVNSSSSTADITPWNGLCLTYTSTQPIYLEITPYDETGTKDIVNYEATLPVATTTTTVNVPWAFFLQESSTETTQETALTKINSVRIKFDHSVNTDFFITKIGSNGMCGNATIELSSSSTPESSSSTPESSAATTTVAKKAFHWSASTDKGLGRVILDTGDSKDQEGYWYDEDDSKNGGTSYFTWPTDVTANPDGNFYGPLIEKYQEIKGTANFKGSYDYPFLTLGFNTVNNAEDGADITAWNGMCLTYTSTKDFSLELATVDESTTTQYNNYKAKVPASTTSVTIDLPWTDFKQESGWGTAISQATALREIAAVKLYFAGSVGTTIDFNIMEIGSLGQCGNTAPESSESQGTSSSSTATSSATTAKSSSSAETAKSSSSATTAKSSSSTTATSSAETATSSGAAATSSSSEEGPSQVSGNAAPQFSLAVSGRSLLVSSAQPHARYAVMDPQGRVLSSGLIQGRSLSITLRHTGTYLVRVGGVTKAIRVQE